MSDDQRLRPRPRDGRTGGDGDGNPGDGPNLARIRERAARLRDVGSGIIESALSGDSERFLEHSRQQGGQ